MNRLKELRTKHGYTLDSLSYSVKIANSALSRMEHGKQAIYDDQAIILADFFKVSIDYLLGREWKEVEKVFVKDPDISYSNILRKLSSLSNRELESLGGAIEFLLIDRGQPSKPNVYIDKSNVKDN